MATQPFHHLSTQLLVVIENVSRFFEPQFLVMVFLSWLNILQKHAKTTYVGCLNSIDVRIFKPKKYHGCFLPPWLFWIPPSTARTHPKKRTAQNLEELATNNIPKPSTVARNVNSSADSSVSSNSLGELVAEWEFDQPLKVSKYQIPKGGSFWKTHVYIWGRPLRYVLWLVLSFDQPERQVPALMGSDWSVV